MSELIPSEKAKEITDKIIKLFEEEEITFEDAADVPAELARRINRNTHCLKKNTIFRLLQ